jgi:hypothetical protein
MLTKVILLKALFEEEIRRRRVEGYRERESHTIIYMDGAGGGRLFIIFISSRASRNEKKIASSEFNTRT